MTSIDIKKGEGIMKLKIIRIDHRIVTCEIEDTNSLLDVARRWFTEDIQEGDTIEIDVTNKKMINNI